jgi:RNA polymerase sigma factor (sigma-70 family)
VTESSAREVHERTLATLTAREREVLELLIQGHHNREVGERLGISPRTVEVHKARLMTKLGARTLSDLMRITRAL